MGHALIGRRRAAPRLTPEGTELLPVAVVIISHNYGRFLTDAIKSVLNQSVAAHEIVVVDDSSTDDTKAVAEQFALAGVRYIRVDARCVNAAREAGFKATESPVLCFLDADDMLAADYLQRGLPHFANHRVSLVYSDWEYFGEKTGRVVFPDFSASNVHGHNSMHCASLVRRSALLAVDAFRHLPDMRRTQHHCDWALWRRVLTGTRIAVKQSSVLKYRQHGSNFLTGPAKPAAPYYDRAALWQEPVTIFVPFSGKPDAARDVLAWLKRQTSPREYTKLVMLDTSQDAEFHQTLRDWSAGSDYPDVRAIRKAVAEKGLASQDYRKVSVRNQVIQAMWRIYDMLPSFDTEYILTVEDDVIPPGGVIDRLLHGMDSNVFSVFSPYIGRHREAQFWMCWDTTGTLVKSPKSGLQATTGNGFGCTLMRRSVLQEWSIGTYKHIPDYDMALYQRLKDEGQWRALVDWDCRSIHAGIKPD